MDGFLACLAAVAVLLVAFAFGQALRSSDAAFDCKRFGAVALQGVVYECKARQ